MENVDVERILSLLDITGKPNGSTIKACCPFHEERNPSWYIEIDEPYRHHCFSCGAKGTIFSLFYKKTGKSLFRELNINRVDRFNEVQTVKDRTTKDKTKERLIHSIEGRLLDCRDNQEVMEYLRKRNPLEPIPMQFLDHFGIKYCVKAEINKPDDSDETGTFFYHRIVTPIVENKTMVGMEGRSYTGAKPKVLYPRNSSVDTLLNIDNLDRNEPLILAEGVFHLPTMFKLGYRNISCIFGASVSNRQLRLLREFREIWYFPDNDNAGMEALKTIDSAMTKDSIYVCTVPKDADKEDKDAGDCTMKEIEVSIENRTDYNSFCYNEIVEKREKDDFFNDIA